MTSNFPFEGNTDVSVVVQIIQGKLPSVHGDDRLDQVMALADLIMDCWSLHPSNRPTAQSCERQVYWMVRYSATFVVTLLIQPCYLAPGYSIQSEWG